MFVWSFTDRAIFLISLKSANEREKTCFLNIKPTHFSLWLRKAFSTSGLGVNPPILNGGKSSPLTHLSMLHPHGASFRHWSWEAGGLELKSYLCPFLHLESLGHPRLHNAVSMLSSPSQGRATQKPHSSALLEKCSRTGRGHTHAHTYIHI